MPTELFSSLDFTFSAADCPLVQLEGWDGRSAQFQFHMSDAFGTSLPASVGEMVRHAGLLAIRIAPHRFWIIFDGPAAMKPIAANPDLGCSLNLDEGRVRFRLGGARIAEVLAKCVAIDWHSPAAAPGRAVHTLLHHVPVLFIRTDNTKCELIVPRSFAQCLVEWILESAEEFSVP